MILYPTIVEHLTLTKVMMEQIPAPWVSQFSPTASKKLRNMNVFEKLGNLLVVWFSHKKDGYIISSSVDIGASSNLLLLIRWRHTWEHKCLSCSKSAYVRPHWHKTFSFLYRCARRKLQKRQEHLKYIHTERLCERRPEVSCKNCESYGKMNDTVLLTAMALLN